MPNYVAKRGSYTLRASVSANGVRFPLRSQGGKWFGGDQSMTLSWTEWDQLATWIAHQRTLGGG